MAQYTQNTLVLGKIESVVGVDSLPNATDDAIQVSDFAYAITVNNMARNVMSGDFSPTAGLIGSKTARFTITVEVKGNGLQQSGLLGDESVLARLFTMCGRQLYGTLGADCVHPVVADVKSSPASKKRVTWTKAVAGVSLTLVHPTVYEIRITTGGTSGVATYSVREDLANDSAWTADEPFETGTAIDLGTSGASITPTIAGSGAVALGDLWRVVVTPAAIVSKPVSSETLHKTGTLYGYLDGTLHRMTASTGTFSITAEAGNIARAVFTMDGNYLEPTDAVMPDISIFEDTIPPQVKLSNLWFGEQKPVGVAAWSFDASNAVTRSPDVNEKEGTRGFKITGRTPTGGFDPDSDVPSRDPIWKLMASGEPQFFSARIGQEPGDILFAYGPRAQVTNVSYKDRDGRRAFDKSLAFTRFQGDDEMIFVFC